MLGEKAIIYLSLSQAESQKRKSVQQIGDAHSELKVEARVAGQ
jgi:hypothetical protein